MRLLAAHVSPRAALLIGACVLAASVVLVRAAQRPEEPVAAPPAPRAQAGAPLDLDGLERRGFPASQADPFAPVVPPPPPAARSSAPRAKAARPAPPPVPFRYLGTFEDGGETAVFLARNDEPVRVEPGATLPGRYRVEAIAGDVVTLRYLPLGTLHKIPIPPRP